jgi:hypothetical protein
VKPGKPKKVTSMERKNIYYGYTKRQCSNRGDGNNERGLKF